MNAKLIRIIQVKLNDQEVPLQQVLLDDGRRLWIEASDVTAANPLDFPLRQVLHVKLAGVAAGNSQYRFAIMFEVQPFGTLVLKFEDELREVNPELAAQKIPRDEANDYTAAIIEERLQFAEHFAGIKLEQLRVHAADPEKLRGNCEHFIGMAQVPIGLAGPLHIRGEWARGEFLIPLATTEGTLIASYNRGMKILNSCGGVITTVQDDVMQRAPAFTFSGARPALNFKNWVDDHFQDLKRVAEASSRYAKLLKVDGFLSNNFAYLRFNFSTGDAAGQNMVTKATYEACLWLLEHCPYKPERFFLESNMATDKKPSLINSLLGRGKRVTAEITFKKEVLERELHVTASQLDYHRMVGNVGAMLAGTNNNGLHSVNAITALFIATGQDVANVSESSACLTHSEVLPNGDLYASITLPSLIVASYGGGTALGTQRECLEMMGCYGEGKAKKLAEIIAGVVAAGEISLAAAISSADWVSSHEALGRNR